MLRNLCVWLYLYNFKLIIEVSHAVVAFVRCPAAVRQYFSQLLLESSCGFCKYRDSTFISCANYNIITHSIDFDIAQSIAGVNLIEFYSRKKKKSARIERFDQFMEFYTHSFSFSPIFCARKISLNSLNWFGLVVWKEAIDYVNSISFFVSSELR